MCFSFAFASFSFGFNQTSDQDAMAAQGPQNSARDWFELGNKLGLNGDSEQAIEAYRRAIELDPQYENGYVELASVLKRTGRSEEPISVLYSGQRFIPASTFILQNLLSALLQAGRDSEAVDIGRKYLALQPRDTSALCNVGGAYLRMKQYDDAMDLFEKAAGIDNKLTIAWFELGMIYQFLNRNDDALAAFQNILDIGPKDKIRNQAWSAKIILLIKSGRRSDATEEIDREIGLNPDNPLAFAMRSGLKLEQNRPEEAIADLKQALSLPIDVPVRSMLFGLLGLSQITISRYPDAIESLNKSVALEPENAGSHALLAMAYFYSSLYDKAIDSLDRAIHSKLIDSPLVDSARFNMMAFTNLALCLTRLQRWQDAEKAARYAVQLDPAELNPRMSLATILMAQNKYGEAESELRACVRQRVADWRTHALLGGLYLGQKRLTEAVPAFRQALKLQPDNPMIMNNLGYTLLELDTNLEEAMDFIKRAVKAVPSNAAFHDSLGWAYFKSGNLVEAEKELLQSAKGGPKSLAAIEHLGDVYRKMERRADALSYWKSALALASDEETKNRLKSKIAGL